MIKNYQLDIISINNFLKTKQTLQLLPLRSRKMSHQVVKASSKLVSIFLPLPSSDGWGH